MRRIFLLIVLVAASLSSAMERQKGSDYRERRMALAKNLNGLAAPGRVVSLSTISTPHNGSPVADFLVAPDPGLLNVGLHLLDFRINVTVGDEEIEAAVVVVIEETAAESQHAARR